MGQKYLVSGKRVSMRLWALEPGGEVKHPTKRDYETVGFVISGSARPEALIEAIGEADVEYALPLIDALAQLPHAATWGEWLDRLTSLSLTMSATAGLHVGAVKAPTIRRSSIMQAGFSLLGDVLQAGQLSAVAR
jgi:hypothetical protein